MTIGNTCYLKRGYNKRQWSSSIEVVKCFNRHQSIYVPAMIMIVFFSNLDVSTNSSTSSANLKPVSSSKPSSGKKVDIFYKPNFKYTYALPPPYCKG